MNEIPKVNGFIGFYNLSEWWFSVFSEEERYYINHHVVWRAGPNCLIEGTPFIRTSSSFFLNNLTHVFRKPKDNHIARRIAIKSYELAEDLNDVDSALYWIIRLNYYVRDIVPGALDLVISACKHQIEIAPLVAKIHKSKYPNLNLQKHKGYDQYVIIQEKNGEYAEVIRLCKEAKKQGWQGDWDNRIERCSKRLLRS